MRDASPLLRWRQRYDPDGLLLHRSRSSLRRPQCFSLRGVEHALDKAGRLSETERAMLMGGACAKAYGWSPKKGA
jgi:hypothetical protein